MPIVNLLLMLAILGTITSTVFLALTIAGSLRFHQEAKQAKHLQPNRCDLPPASILKPVHGMEAQLTENLESFFRQDYPAYEVLIAADEENDPALEVARNVKARHQPRVPLR